MSVSSRFETKEAIKNYFIETPYITSEDYADLETEVQGKNCVHMKDVTHIEKIIEIQKKRFINPIYPKVALSNSYPNSKKILQNLVAWAVEEFKKSPRVNFVFMPTGHYVGVMMERKDGVFHVFYSDCLDLDGTFDGYGGFETVYLLARKILERLGGQPGEEVSLSISNKRRQEKDGIDCSIFALRDIISLENTSIADLPVEKEVRYKLESSVLEDKEIKIRRIDLSKMPRKYRKISQTEPSPKELKVTMDLERKRFTTGWAASELQAELVKTTLNGYSYYLNIKYLAGL